MLIFLSSIVLEKRKRESYFFVIARTKENVKKALFFSELSSLVGKYRIYISRCGRLRQSL